MPGVCSQRSPDLHKVITHIELHGLGQEASPREAVITVDLQPNHQKAYARASQHLGLVPLPGLLCHWWDLGGEATQGLLDF